MRISCRRITVHTKHPFRIARAHSSVDGRDVHRVIVRIEHDGTVGYGEAAPSPFYRQTAESVETVIDRLQREPAVLGDDAFQIESVVGRLVNDFDDQRAAVAAIDAALHDWVGRRLNVPVWRLLGLDGGAISPTSMTIGIDDLSGIRERVAEAGAFDVLKIKVGTEGDAEILSAVRNEAPDKRLRLDANTAWTAEEALDRIARLAVFKPELVEQPIAPGQRRAFRRIHEQSSVPIFVDEDCIRPGDIPGWAGCVTGVNIKLAKCGGIREALRAIHLARASGLQVMLGCMVETSLGISAAVHIGSLVDFIDLDGHLLLADDPFDAVRLEGDRVLPTDRPGLGADASWLFDSHAEST